MAFTRLASLVVLSSFLTLHLQGESLTARAWDLYVTANYEGALAVLNDAEAETTTPAERQTLRECRALCLLALDQTRDAADVMAQMVAADLAYQPQSDRRPPRFNALFTQVRRQRLQVLGRNGYDAAARAFDEHRYEEAEAGLTSLLRLLGTAGLDGAPTADGNSDETGWLTMLRARATQFLAVVRAHEKGSAGQTIAARNYFDSGDAGVTPPVALRQDIPAWPGTGAETFEGDLALVIGPGGEVREAALMTSIHPDYDPVILKAAKLWTFRPAARDGHAVSYRMVMTIRVSPQRRVTSAP